METIRIISRARDAISAGASEAEKCPPHQRASLLTAVTHWKNELERLRADLREALMERKRHTDTLHDRQRNQLLGDGARSPPPHKEDADSTARHVASSLTRSRKLMADQVQRMSGVAAQVLEQDALLRDTLEEHRGVGGSIRRAGGSLTNMQRQQIIDWCLIAGSTLFYVLTVLYVIWARIPGFGLV